MDNFTYTAQEILNRPRNGIAYGRGCRVLVKTGRWWLLWVPGQGVWSGTGCPWTYAPAHLILAGDGRYVRLHEGGRLTKAILASAERIDLHLGEGVSKLVDPKRTLTLGGLTPP